MWWIALPAGAQALRPSPDWSHTPTTTAFSPAVSALGAGDVDGDGRADLVWYSPVEDRYALAASDAALLLRDPVDVPLGGETPSAPLLLTDVDGDGAADLVARTLAPDPGVSVWLSVGGSFGDPTFRLDDGLILSPLGDASGDGVPDFAVGLVPWFGGAPPLVGPAIPGSLTYSDRPFPLGDLDGDGRGELLVPDHVASGWYDVVSGPAHLAEWDGAAWQSGWALDLGDATAELATLADVDGDGTHELVSANLTRMDESLGGTLTVLADLADPLGPTILTTTDLGDIDAGQGVWLGSLGDTDGDGVDEVLFASYGEIRELAWDPVTGLSAAGRTWGDAQSTISALTTADVDGDGRLDLVGSFTLDADARIAVWLTASPGTGTTPPPSTTSTTTDTATDPTSPSTPALDTAGPASEADESSKGGCGCGSAPASAAGWLFAALGAVVRRRGTARGGRR